MKHGKLILGELHADIPVIQGVMGVGISLSGLAGFGAGLTIGACVMTW